MLLFILKSILLGTGLAIDASSVSMANGFKYPKLKMRVIIAVALTFGLFQAFMPLLGYLIGSSLAAFFSKFTPWLALLLLGFLGTKMIVEAIKSKAELIEEKDYNLTIKLVLTQGVATAIDALSVGLLMVNYTTVEVIIAISIIAVVTFILSYIAYFIGKKFGLLFREKAEIFGGIILIAIGLEIFISGVFF